MKPTVGRIVHFVYQGEVIPAIITRVWTDTCVNLRLFPDANSLCAEQTRTSVTYSDAAGSNCMWSWPPRENLMKIVDIRSSTFVFGDGRARALYGPANVQGGRKLIGYIAEEMVVQIEAALEYADAHMQTESKTESKTEHTDGV